MSQKRTTKRTALPPRFLLTEKDLSYPLTDSFTDLRRKAQLEDSGLWRTMQVWPAPIPAWANWKMFR